MVQKEGVGGGECNGGMASATSFVQKRANDASVKGNGGRKEIERGVQSQVLQTRPCTYHWEKALVEYRTHGIAKSEHSQLTNIHEKGAHSLCTFHA